MKEIVVIGESSLLKSVIYLIKEQSELKIIGVIVDDLDNFSLDYKVLGTFKQIPDLLKTHNLTSGVVAIRNTSKRKFIVESIQDIFSNFDFESVIHDSAVIGKNVFLGDGVLILAGVVINSDAIVGDFCSIGSQCSVGHEVILSNFSCVCLGVVLGGNVVLGECSSISFGTSVIENVKIGNYVTIGMSSLVLKRIPDFTVVEGVPAKEVCKQKLKGFYPFTENDSLRI